MSPGAQDADVVCVGGGLGGLAAAASASARGLRCLVLEAADVLGGGGAYSGGLLWAPTSTGDSVADAAAYLAHVQGQRDGDDDLRREVLEAMVEAWEEYAGPHGLGVGLDVVPGNPDAFHPAPGSRAEGRMWEVALDGRALGDLRERLSPSPHYAIGLRHRELYGGDLPADEVAPMLRLRQADDLLTMGPGLAAGFLHAAAVVGSAQVETGVRVVRLLTDGGRVSGVVLDDGRVVTARLGVVLATGGYGWADDAADVEGAPGFVEAGPPTIRGDHLGLAGSLGARVVRGGGPQLVLGAQVDPGETHPGTTAPLHRQMFDAVGKPHSLVVNAAGRRFTDESYYVGMTEALTRWSPATGTYENLPCWLVVDEQYHRRYPLGGLPAGAPYPSTVTSADDPRALAALIGVDPDGLVATLERFNRHAEGGEDPDFGRGSSAFVRRRYGDPHHAPNATLGPVVEPPFHALRLAPLGVGLCSFGLATDAHARVLRWDGGVVEGLHAVGNAAATTEMRGYVTGYANARNLAMARRAVVHLVGERPAAGTTAARPGRQQEGTPA